MNQDDDTDSEPELVIPSRGTARDRSPEVRRVCAMRFTRGAVGASMACPPPPCLLFAVFLTVVLR